MKPSHVDAVVAQLAAAVGGDAPPSAASEEMVRVCSAVTALLPGGDYSEPELLLLRAQIGCKALELLSRHLAAGVRTERALLSIGQPPMPPEVAR